ncbi:hypothetical protein ACEZCY_14265 [Streptacidiphilus sp. N1-12]|uniref:Uncharacterized protein n=2 Tax=Streptacidiphilus alkalitolerans TaxID=3342712 RepID=A0ABV6WEH1_9ACTN
MTTWPPSWPTVQVRADYTVASPDGDVPVGTVRCETVPARIPSAEYGVITVGQLNVDLVDGQLAVHLAATPDDGSWVWKLTQVISGTTTVSIISIPASEPVVDLLAVEYPGVPPLPYTVITGPSVPGTKGDPGHTPQRYTGDDPPTVLHEDGDDYLRTNGDYYLQAAGAWTGPLLNLRGPKGDKGDSGGGGGGGTTILWADAWIASEIVTLPDSPSAWVPVRTSGGTLIGCSIAGSTAGSMARLGMTIMRTANCSFLDIGILDPNDPNNILAFCGSRGPVALEEGNPGAYPLQSSYPSIFGPQPMVVDPSWLDGSGNLTVAVVCKGANADGSRKVYAHPGYPATVTMEVKLAA